MDWKTIVTIFQGIILIVNIGIFMIIKFNDLKHLTNTVNEIKEDLKKNFAHNHKMDKKIVAIVTRCNERHNISIRKKK